MSEKKHLESLRTYFYAALIDMERGRTDAAIEAMEDGRRSITRRLEQIQSRLSSGRAA